MPPVCVYCIGRNEASRHLRLALGSAKALADATGGCVCFVDDCSDDDTAEVAARFGADVRRLPRPTFWRHEGRARQATLEFAAGHCRDGWWMLALDCDEQIDDPAGLAKLVGVAAASGVEVVRLRLYEMWSATEYRVDGQWSSGVQPRLHLYRPGSTVAVRPMGGGQTPMWTRRHPHTWVGKGVGLLHWGYVRPGDRRRKMDRYLSRRGGHGHSARHIRSIVGSPTLRDYPWADRLPDASELGLVAS